MGRLSRFAALPLLTMLVAACGPTAEVVTTPAPTPESTPASAASPSATRSVPGESRSPAAPPASPGASISPATPMPNTAPPSAPPSAPPPSPLADSFVHLADFPAAGAFEVADVTASASGFVAVGFGALADEGYFGRRQGFTWSSTDGATWQPRVDPELEFVTPLRVAARANEVFLLGLLATCPQIFEDPCQETPDAGNALWRSSDGGPWERLSVPADMQLGLVDDVVVAGEQLIIYGSTGEELETSSVWRSTDAVSWSAVAELGGLDPVSALAAGPETIVAFGTRYMPESDRTEVTAATSSDAAVFTPASVPVVTDATVGDVVSGANGFVGVGYGQSDDGALMALALHSDDGVEWVLGSAGDGSFADSGLVEVDALESGYSALGFEQEGDDFGVQSGRTWYSADGNLWQAHLPLGGTFTQFSASAIGPGGLIVFTVDQEELDDDEVSSVIGAWLAPSAALVP